MGSLYASQTRRVGDELGDTEGAVVNWARTGEEWRRFPSKTEGEDGQWQSVIDTQIALSSQHENVRKPDLARFLIAGVSIVGPIRST